MSREEVNQKYQEAIEKGAITGASFQEEIAGTSRVFGRDQVSVVFEGDKAYTDGTTIVYPSIDVSAVLTEDEVKIGRGFVDHEAAHIRHSDMEFAINRVENAQKLGNEQLVKMFNCVEDVRIERLANKNYRGAHKNLSAVADASTEMYLKAVEQDPSIPLDEKKLAAVALSWQGRSNMDYQGDNLQKALDTVPASLRTALKKWASEIEGLKNTQESYDLARRILKDLNDETYQQPQYEEQPTGAGLEPDEEAEEEGEGEGEGEEGPQQGNGNKDGKEKGKEQEGQGQQPQAGFDPYNNDYGDLMNNLFENLAKPSWGTYKAWSTRYDKEHHVSDPYCEGGTTTGNAGRKIMKNKSSLKEYYNRLKKASGSINVMKRKLEKAIQAKQRIDWDFARQQGRLDSKRLTAAYGWQPNVYKVKTDAPALDTAITILIDLSGSMSGRRVDLATDVAICLYECLTKIGVSFEILGWNNVEEFSSSKERNEYYKNTPRKTWKTIVNTEYARVAPLHLYVFKSFKDKPREARQVIPTIKNCVTGWNSDGEAVSKAYARLKVRPEKRKILMVLSDGQPASDGTTPNMYGVQKTFLRNTIHRIEKDKVDLIGIGIQSEAVKQFYPKYVVCNTLEDLPKATFDMISKALLGEKFVIDNSELIALKEGTK